MTIEEGSVDLAPVMDMEALAALLGIYRLFSAIGLLLLRRLVAEERWPPKSSKPVMYV